MKKYNSYKSLSDKLSTDELEFLSMTYAAAKSIADRTQNVASEMKNTSDEELKKATREASNGVFEVAHAAKNANQVDFRSSNLFCEVNPAKNPGKKSFDHIAETIMDTYAKGRNMLGLDSENNVECTNQHFTNRQEVPAAAPRKVMCVIDDIITSVGFFFHAGPPNRDYIMLKGLDLSDDVQGLTNNVITCKLEETILTLRSKTGRDMTLSLANLRDYQLKEKLRDCLIRLFINAAISQKTREEIMQVVDIESIEELSFMSCASARHDAKSEGDNVNSETTVSVSPEKSCGEIVKYADELTTENDEPVGRAPNSIHDVQDNANASECNAIGSHKNVPARILNSDSCNNARDSPSAREPLKVFTCFSGYDSQLMALEKLHEEYGLNFEFVGWSEIDKYAITSHNAAFPDYAGKNYGDITKIDWEEVGGIDLLTYSSPCQDFSRAGLRRGGEKGSGTRSSLLWECHRAIEVKRPKYLLFENVKGLVDKTMRHTFEEWQSELCKLGYINYSMVLNAADYNCPQHRERVIMVSIKVDDIDNLPVFEFPKPVSLTKTVDDVLEYGVDAQNYLTPKKTEAFFDLLENAKPGYKVDTDCRKYYEIAEKPKGKRIKSFVTPTCKGGLLPTLTASGIATPSTMYSTGSRPCPGVVEIWDTNFKQPTIPS